jgi:hypothetical protein
VRQANTLAVAGRAAALALGLMLAGVLFLLLLMGDCWAAHDTPEATRLCEIEKSSDLIMFMVLAGTGWIAGLVQALRGRPFARRLALLSGPVAFVAVGVLV